MATHECSGQVTVVPSKSIRRDKNKTKNHFGVILNVNGGPRNINTRKISLCMLNVEAELKTSQV